MIDIDKALDNIDLKPCPYCGRQAVIVSHPGRNWDGKEKHINTGAMYGLWYVGCPYEILEGWAEGPMCEIAPGAKWFSKLSRAIEIWNTRG